MTESEPKTRRFFPEHPKFGFFVQELNPGIDPTKLGIQSGKQLTLKCPDCKHVFPGKPHGLKNCRFCVHQELCDNDDCEMCFGNSLASRHFAGVEKYKEFKRLYASGAEYVSVAALFLPTCAIYDFRNNTVSCRSVFKSSSNPNVLFICRECDHGFPNRPYKIASLIDCPFCSPANAKMLCPKEKECSKCFAKSFASHPKAEFWDYSEGKNGGKTPHDVFIAGHHLADFVCGECAHPFQASCNSVSTGFWCPFCVGQKRCSATDCDLCNGRKLSSHPMAKFWDEELNSKDITPADISLGDSRNLYWFKCPAGRHPSFQKRPSKIYGGCPSCLRKTEAKIGEFLPTVCAYEREWKAEWLREPTTNCCARFDFMLSSLNTVVENDGPHHFIDGCFKSKAYIHSDVGNSKETMLRDVMKMKKAVSNGVSGMRLFQPDVLTDAFDWRGWIRKAIIHITASSVPIWAIPKNPIYDAHIQLCIEHGINYVVIDAL